MDEEKGFMLKKDKIEWKEREGKLLSVKQETIEKRTGVVEIRSHQVFQTEKDAIDEFNKLQNPKTKVTSKKQANKDLKAKIEEAKQKQAEDTNKRFGVINGKVEEITAKNEELDTLMSEESIENIEKEMEAAVKEAKLEELKEKYRDDPETYQYLRAGLLDDEELIEEQREIYEEVKEVIMSIKQIVDVEMRKQNIEGYRRGFRGAQNIKRLIFDRFFDKEYREIMKTKVNTGSLEAEDSLADVLSNKMGMIQNKNHQLYLKSLKELADKEVKRKKADYMRRKEEAEKEKREIEPEDYAEPVTRLLEHVTYQDLLDAMKKGISVNVFWTSLLAKSK